MVFVTVQDFHFMCQKHFNHLLKKKDRSSLRLSASDSLILESSHSKVLSFFMRSMLLGLLFLSFTWLSLLRYGTVSSDSVGRFESTELSLPLILNDLEKEGLFKLGGKALLLSNGDKEVTVSSYSQTVVESEMLLVSPNDQEMQNMVPNETFDLAFAHDHHVESSEFIDRALKVGGILTVQINLQELPSGFLKLTNYEIVYARSFESTVMAMRKVGEIEGKQSLVASGRKLLGIKEDAKKNALSNLEDVLLEPPRAASRKSRTYLKRTRYLPDLMGDKLDLESYSRRIFIDVGIPENGKESSGMEWFMKNYPTRNLKFEMYKIETVNDEMSLESEKMGMTEWLKENVKEEEYIVMKAEAEVVEEMMRSKSIKMVDELFLECKPKGLGVRGKKRQGKGGRAYWECLALYGKLRDEGVAVHQWWG